MGATNKYILKDTNGTEIFRGTKRELADKYGIPYHLNLMEYVENKTVYDGKYAFEVEQNIPGMEAWAREWDETRMHLRRKCGYE